MRTVLSSQPSSPARLVALGPDAFVGLVTVRDDGLTSCSYPIKMTGVHRKTPVLRQATDPMFSPIISDFINPILMLASHPYRFLHIQIDPWLCHLHEIPHEIASQLLSHVATPPPFDHPVGHEGDQVVDRWNLQILRCSKASRQGHATVIRCRQC